MSTFSGVFSAVYAAAGLNVYVAEPWGPSVVGLFVAVETLLFASNARWSETASSAVLLGAFFAILYPSPNVVFSIVSGLYAAHLFAYYIVYSNGARPGV